MITREEIEKTFTYNCVDRAIKYCRKTYPHYDGDKMGEITDAFEAGAEWAKDFIIESSYDSLYGARPLKRFLQSEIETLIAKKIIGDDIPPETTLTVDCENGKLIVKT